MNDYPQSITVTLPPKYNKIIRDYAKFINKPLNQIIIEAVKEYITLNLTNDIIK